MNIRKTTEKHINTTKSYYKILHKQQKQKYYRNITNILQKYCNKCKYYHQKYNRKIVNKYTKLQKIHTKIQKYSKIYNITNTTTIIKKTQNNTYKNMQKYK